MESLENVRTVISGRDVLNFILNGWLPILAAAATGCVVGVSLALVPDPIYRAQVVALVANDEMSGSSFSGLAAQFGGLASMAGIGLRGDSNYNEALAVLNSRSFAVSVIHEYEMAYEFFDDKWDEETQSWSVKQPEDAPSDLDAWLFYRENVVSTIEDREKDLITLRVEWKDPLLAASWANAIVKRANDSVRLRRLKELDHRLAYLQQELDRTDLTVLRQAIARVMEAQVYDRMIANVREDIAFEVIDPAVPPDFDRPVWPSKPLWAAFGLVFGGLIGIAILIYRAARFRASDS